MFGPLSISVAPYVRSSRSLYKWVKPIASWYANLAGYRQMGLRYDDLVVEERPDVQRALSRLTPLENYDRAWRFKLASQASILHKPLPKEQWVKPDQDIPYLRGHIEDVMKEDGERRVWDTMTIERTS